MAEADGTHMTKIGMIWTGECEPVHLPGFSDSVSSLVRATNMSAIECPSLLAAIHPRFSLSVCSNTFSRTEYEIGDDDEGEGKDWKPREQAERSAH